MPTFDSVTLDVSDRVGILTLNRPQVLNAFHADMVDEMERAFDHAFSLDIGALVVTGSGRAFCAGADLKSLVERLQNGVVGDGAVLVGAGGRMAKAIRKAKIPVIAAVNGPAAGGGCNLALACDLRFAGSSAKFGQVFNKIGLIPDWGGTFFLPRLVGVPKALELIWSADMIDADEALSIGLINRVYPDDKLMEETLAFARKVAEKPAEAVDLAKLAIYTSPTRDLADMLMWEEENQVRLFGTESVWNAVASFLGKEA